MYPTKILVATSIIFEGNNTSTATCSIPSSTPPHSPKLTMKSNSFLPHCLKRSTMSCSSSSSDDDDDDDDNDDNDDDEDDDYEDYDDVDIDDDDSDDDDDNDDSDSDYDIDDR